MTLGVGIDMWAGKWAIAVLEGNDAQPTVQITSAKTLADALAPWVDAAERPPVAIDVPLRVPNTSLRDAETEAKKQIAGLGSTLFPAIPQSLWGYGRSEGNAVARRDLRTGFSAQAWSLVKAMKEADALRQALPDMIEAHPEISFRCALAAPRALASKHSWTGMQQRVDVLKSVGIVLPKNATEKVGAIDALDATICAWTARCVAVGAFSRIGSVPTDSWIAKPLGYVDDDQC